jgi:hypothetical protein
MFFDFIHLCDFSLLTVFTTKQIPYTSMLVFLSVTQYGSSHVHRHTKGANTTLTHIRSLLQRISSYCLTLATACSQISTLLSSWAAAAHAHATTQHLLTTHHRGRRIMLLLLICSSAYRGMSCSYHYRGFLWGQPWQVRSSSSRLPAAAAVARWWLPGGGSSGSSQLVSAWAQQAAAAVAAAFTTGGVAGHRGGGSRSSSSSKYLSGVSWLQQQQKKKKIQGVVTGWASGWGKGLVQPKAVTAWRRCPRGLGKYYVT